MNEIITTRTSETVGAIASALCKAQAAMGKLTKDKANPFFRSKYADLAQVCEVCLPKLNDAGIAVIHGGGLADQQALITCRFIHESGEWIEGVMPMPVKEADNPQAMGSTITYGRRYLFAAMACIAPEDDDGNAAIPKAPGTKATAKAANPAPAPKAQLTLEDAIKDKAVQSAIKKARLTKMGEVRKVWESVDWTDCDDEGDRLEAFIAVLAGLELFEDAMEVKVAPADDLPYEELKLRSERSERR